MFGAPAAGKDTVNAHLTAAAPRMRHFQKLKCGGGRTTGYEIVSAERLKELRSLGRIMSEVERYGAVYAVDRDRLARMEEQGLIPILHTASMEEWSAMTGLHTLAVLLDVSRDEAQRRLLERDKSTVKDRLAVFDRVALDIPKVRRSADLILESDRLSAADAASAVLSKMGLRSA